MRRAAWVCLIAGCTLSVSACSGGGLEKLPETGATLEGTVTFKGEPVQFALVIAVGPDGKGSATGNIREDGKYRMTNVPLGEVKVAVNTEAGKGDYMSKVMSQSYQGPEAKVKGKKASLKFIDVPKQYHDPEKSGLSTTIKEGANTYNIEIK
jgi:hypothetical protein